ncbi:unnamed protein product [Amoebophrya sp. A120]|nr:unnamed protein product [Amoebophrya sp. A120]|eukprot:GSA120T00014589001.1
MAGMNPRTTTTLAQLFQDGAKIAKAAAQILDRPSRQVLGKAKQAGVVFPAAESATGSHAAGSSSSSMPGAAMGASTKSLLNDIASAENAHNTMVEATKTANEALEVLDVNLRVLGPNDPNWVKLQILPKEDGGDGKTDGAAGSETSTVGADASTTAGGSSSSSSSASSSSSPSFSREDARKFVELMADAKRVRLGDVLLETYIDNLLSDAKFKRIVQLPAVLERKIYYDLIRTTLQIFEIGLLKLNGSDLLGHELTINLKHLEYGEDEDTVKPLQAWTVLHQKRVERVMKRVIRERESCLKYLPSAKNSNVPNFLSDIEGDFIITISQIVMRLMNDLFSPSRIKIRMLGHELKWECEPMNQDQIDQFLSERRRPAGDLINKESVNMFVEELLNCDDTNIVWVPDSLESKVYAHIMTTVVTILEDVLNSSEVSILGLKWQFSLVSALDTARKKKTMKRSLSVMRYHHQSSSMPLSEETTTVTTEGSGRLQSEDEPNNSSSSTSIGNTTTATQSSTEAISEDDSIPFWQAGGNVGTVRERLNTLYQEATVIENLLKEKENATIYLPYKGFASPQSSSTATGSAGESSPAGGAAVDGTGTSSSPFDQFSSTAGAAYADAEINLTDGRASSPSSSATSSLPDQAANKPFTKKKSLSSLADISKREFQKLAAQDQLARYLQVRRKLKDMDIEIPFKMIRDVETYSQWMPMCTGGQKLPDNVPAGAKPAVKVAFGIETNTFLGVLGDDVTYEMEVFEPTESAAGPGSTTVEARIIADTGARGFAYGDRLVYDWIFISKDNETEVSLNLFLKVNSVLYLPIWDTMQAVLTDKMLQAFEEHAKKIK